MSCLSCSSIDGLNISNHSYSACPCNKNGVYLVDSKVSVATASFTVNDWFPYKDCLQFEVADFLYSDNQMSGAKIDKLMELWAASVLPHGSTPPFCNHDDLYHTIDLTPLGKVSWHSFEMTHPAADSPDRSDAPSWMTETYKVWYRDVCEVIHSMLTNPDFKTQINYAPVQEFDTGSVHQLRNFMGSDWAWAQAVSVLLVLYLELCADILVGYCCTRSKHSQGCLCSCDPWQQQNNGVCCHRSEQILPSLCIHRQHPQHHLSCPL